MSWHLSLTNRKESALWHLILQCSAQLRQIKNELLKNCELEIEHGSRNGAAPRHEQEPSAIT